MVIFDTSVLLLLIDPKAKPPKDNKMDAPVERAYERVANLVSSLKIQNKIVFIPAPVLCEAMIGFGKSTEEYMNIFEKEYEFIIIEFGQKAAIEAVQLIKKAIGGEGLGKYAADHNTTREKMKFDLQIMAIAKVKKVHTIYPDDRDIHRYAEELGITAYGAADLPLPPEPYT